MNFHPEILFSLDISAGAYALIGAAAIFAALILMLLLPPLARVRRAVRRGDAEADALREAPRNPDAEWPGVSIIVHAQSDASTLSVLLPMLLAQEYDGPMEVIVVNDGNDEGVNNVVARLESEYRNLYMTYTPDRSRNLSRRKLAITLGVKAARFEMVLVMSGSSRLVSDQWLSLMMLSVASYGKEIVAGYGYFVPSDSADQRHNRVMAFETVRTAAQYLGSALGGRMYRAFGYNLAYRRDLFFQAKGFSGSLELRYGDDDLFVSRIATRDNFAVQLAREAMVEMVEDSPVRMYRLDRLAHDFTTAMLHPAAPLRWAAISWLWWGWLAASVAGSVASLPSLIPLIAALVIMIALWIPVMVSWRRVSVALCSRRLFLLVPLLMLAQPFNTLYYRILGRVRRNHNYTWSSTTN